MEEHLFIESSIFIIDISYSHDVQSILKLQNTPLSYNVFDMCNIHILFISKLYVILYFLQNPSIKYHGKSYK